MPIESKTMTWGGVRVRVAGIARLIQYDCDGDSDLFEIVPTLLAAIDAAAPAMEQQAKDAARFVALIQDIEQREGIAAGARMILAADLFVQEQKDTTEAAKAAGGT